MTNIPSPNEIAVALRTAYQSGKQEAFNFALGVAVNEALNGAAEAAGIRAPFDPLATPTSIATNFVYATYLSTVLSETALVGNGAISQTLANSLVREIIANGGGWAIGLITYQILKSTPTSSNDVAAPDRMFAAAVDNARAEGLIPQTGFTVSNPDGTQTRYGMSLGKANDYFSIDVLNPNTGSLLSHETIAASVLGSADVQDYSVKLTPGSTGILTINGDRIFLTNVGGSINSLPDGSIVVQGLGGQFYELQGFTDAHGNGISVGDQTGKIISSFYSSDISRLDLGQTASPSLSLFFSSVDRQLQIDATTGAAALYQAGIQKASWSNIQFVGINPSDGGDGQFTLHIGTQDPIAAIFDRVTYNNVPVAPDGKVQPALGGLGLGPAYLSGYPPATFPATSAASQLESEVNNAVGLDTPPANSLLNNSLLSVSLQQLGQVSQPGAGSGGDGTSFGGSNVIVSTGGVLISASGQAGADTASLSSTEIATGNWRPYYSMLQSGFNDFAAATSILNSPSTQILLAQGVPTGDLVPAATLTNPAPSFTDPLLLDLTGAGINVSNWIQSPVYFDTNVVPDANGNPTTTPDGLQHETAWMKAGTGMLVFEASGMVTPITNITQTVSQFLNTGPTPARYADGLAALASLVKTDPATGLPYTVFNAQTAAIDPTTHVSYWNEIMVWNDANHNGVSDAGEIVSLASLGITSISLVGSGNQGESINGSAVTNRTTFTKTDGTTGQAAAVNFQNDSIGNIATTVAGGIVIKSLSEGGLTLATTFVAENTSAHTYSLQNGKLTDTTTGAVIATSGISAVLSSSQNDVISVAASDTGTYWLGGGTGADTLTGGGGTNVFLVNPNTVVHGGTGANSFNIAKVIGTQGVTIDLATAHLNEVIGGSGGSVFNASGTTWNVFIQATSGNNIIIGGAATDALSGGTGDDLIELGPGGGVVHAGQGNDVIYGGSGTTSGKPNSDVIYAGPGSDIVQLGTNNSEVFDGTGTLTLIGNAHGFSVLGLHGSFADYSLAHNADGTITVTNINNMDGDGTVTMKNVTALDFKDISQVAVATTTSLPVNDQLNTGNAAQVTTNASGQYIITTAALLQNDINYAGGSVAIQDILDNSNVVHAVGSAATVNGGTATLNANGTITFTPTPGYTGLRSFRYNMVNGAVVQQTGTSNTAPMSATVYLNTPSDPTDPLFDSEWFLQAINVLPAWKDYTGAGIKVGVFDTSGNVDFSNLDLAPNAGSSRKADLSPGVDQIGTHATLVAGVIAAARNGQGAVGVAPDATIGSEVASQFINLLDWQNYDVVNNSFGPGGQALFLNNAIAQPALAAVFQNAAAYGRGGLGTVIVFAGGNGRQAQDNTNYHNESNSRYAINVGGINATSDLGALQVSGAPFSNPGASILVSAPANNISSDGVTFTNEFGQQFGANIQTTAGTSFATPIVSGVVALMLQANPNLGYRDVQKILAYSATKVDPTGSNWTFNGAINWNGGGLHTSEDYGFGEVDAHAAVRLAATWAEQSSVAKNELIVNAAFGNTSQSPTGASLNYAITADDGVPAHHQYSMTIPNLSQYQLSVEHVDVELNMQGVNPNNLIIKLIAPSGVTSTLVNKPPAGLNPTSWTGTGQNIDFNFDSVRDYGEGTNGTWSLLIEYAAGSVPMGTLNGIYINFYGSAPSNTQTMIYTDEFASLGIGSRAVISEPSGTATTINVAATTGTVNLDLNAGSTDSSIDGKALTIAAGTQVDQVFLGDGTSIVYGNGDPINTFVAGTGNDTIYGGSGTDIFYAGGTNGLPKKVGTDTFIGGSGDNTFYLGDGVANVTGSSIGSNTIDFRWASSAVVINLATGVNGGAAAKDTFSNIQTIYGSNFGDTISAWGGMTLVGGTATNNTLDYTNAPAPVTVDFSQGTAQVGTLATFAQDSIRNFQRVIGSSDNDYFTDGSMLSFVDGGGGSNILDFSNDPNGISLNLAAGTGTGGFGQTMSIKHVQLVAGALYHSNTIVGANDTYYVSASVVGGDKFTANSANTQVSFASESSGVTVNLATGVATFSGALKSDVLTNVDLVEGSAHNDTLTGNGSYSGLDGYLGNDTLIGGGGYDVYYFAQSAGYGQDIVYNGTGSGAPMGEIDIGNGYTPQNIWLSQSGNDLVVTILGTTSTMTVKNWFTNPSAQLQQIVAGNGSAIGTSAIGTLQAAMAAYQANNHSFNPQTAMAIPTSLLGNVASLWGAGVITGMGGNDTLDPGVGNTTLYGNGGNDTYELRAGYGADVIVNGLPTNTGPKGTLQLSAGLDPSNLWFTKSTNGDLVIQVLNSPTQMTVKGWFNNSYSQLQSLVLVDGSRIGTAAIAALANAMTAFQQSSGFNPVTATDMPAAVQAALNTNWSRVITSGASNATLSGVYGNNTFDPGGALNDTLIGGSGSNTFVYNSGYGQLEINEQGASTPSNNVVQMTGTNSANVTVMSDGTNLYLTDGIAGDLIKLDSFASGPTTGVQTVQFADTTWHLTDLQSRSKSPILGSLTGSDFLVGTSGANYFDGLGAPTGQTDVITGGGGNDIFLYNKGYGSLEINENGAAGDQSILKLGANISLQTITLHEDAAGDLIVTDGLAGDQMKLDNYFNGSNYGPQVIQFADGTFLTKANVILGSSSTVSFGSEYLTGSVGANYIDRGAVQAFAYVTDGGGNDVFIYNKGYGGLQINDVNSPTTSSLLKLGAGITESGLYLSTWGGRGLTMTFNDGTVADNGKVNNDGLDIVQVPSFLNATTGSTGLNRNWGPQTTQFADGTTLTRDQLLAMFSGAGAFDEMLLLQGTSGNALPSSVSGVFSQTAAQAASHTVAVTAFGDASLFTFILDERNVQVKSIRTSGNSLFVTEQGGTVDTFTYSGTVGTVSNLAWIQTSPGIYAVMAASTGTTLNPSLSTANAAGTGTVNGANVTYVMNTFVNSNPYLPLRTANDVFFFNGVAYRDTVTDFHAGDTAVFDLSAFDSGTASVSVPSWGTPSGVSGAAPGYYALVTGKVNGTAVNDWLYFQNLTQEQTLQLTQVSPTAVQVAVSATLTPVNGVVTGTTSTSDIMTGDSQPDTFKFSGLLFGNDTITNLKAGDQIQIDLSTNADGPTNVFARYNADPTKGPVGDYIYAQGNVYAGDGDSFESSSIYFGNLANGQLAVQSNGNNHWTVSLGSTPTYNWVGSATNATLAGSNYGNNTFQLGGGAETATGGRLANIYQASSATGQAQIILPLAAGEQNELDFTGALSDESLWFLQSGSDLTIDLLGTSSNVTVKNFFGTSGSHMQEITAGGLKIDGGVSQLVQAMAAFSSAHSGFSPTVSGLTMPNDATLQNTIAAAWHA